MDRIQHFAGDIPPTLSPLDAFAAHSRRLARELEETRKAGERRVSRLPPHIVTKSLTEHQANRPHYFRTLSGGSSPASGSSPGPQDGDGPGISPEVSHPNNRPLSSYPRLSTIPSPAEDENDDDDKFVTPREIPTAMLLPRGPAGDYFGIPRAQSPSPIDASPTSKSVQVPTQRTNLPDIAYHFASAAPPSNSSYTLAPPRPHFTRDINNNRPHNEASDDEYPSSNAGSTFSAVRRLSSNSNISLPQTPASPFTAAHLRSASGTSTNSAQSSRASRAQMNFSRPMSAASLTNLRDSPIRHQSKKSQLSQPSAASLDLPRTPLSFDEPRPRNSDDGYVTASSYTYGRFALPRGRMADRNSQVFLGLSSPAFEWQEPLFPSTPPRNSPRTNPISKPSAELARPSGDAQRSDGAGFSFDLGGETTHTGDNALRPTTAQSANGSIKTSSSVPRPSTSAGAASRPIRLPPMPTIPSEKESVSSRSNSTIRPTTARTTSNYQSLSADDHVSKAIDLHQHGDLKESTYHFRIAAKQHHPTAMLLYALACRHGWGMRPNPKEGVSWLRQAMDSALSEVTADDSSSLETRDPQQPQPVRDTSEKKAHRAQFALSIYELGVSHLNGWGTEQDKALALRCFEIAGEWGDTDALTEAGFCYAEGIGCKKDLKKAAKFYRRAADRGVSMVGNSW